MFIRKQFYLYVNALSDLGSRMDLIAFSALIFSFENSPFWLMAFFLARQIGGILSSFYAGVLADRFDRRSLMIASVLLSGLAVVSVLVFPYPYVVVAAAFLKGIFYTVFQVGFHASIPEIFGESHVLRVNALVIRLEAAAGIIGFVIGGVLADRLGYGFVIAFDAATFFLSAAALLGLRWDSRPARTTNEHRMNTSSLAANLREVWSYLKLYPVFLVVSLVSLFYTFSTAGYNFGLPLLSMQLKNGTATTHGLMWAFLSIGSLAGSFIVSRFKTDFVKGLLIAMLFWSVLVIVTFATGQLTLILLLLIAVGLVDAAIRLYDRSVIQASDNQVRGRILGTQTLLSRAGFLIGFFIAPYLTSAFSLLGMVSLFQTGTIAAVLIIIFSLRKKETLRLGQRADK